MTWTRPFGQFKEEKSPGVLPCLQSSLRSLVLPGALCNVPSAPSHQLSPLPLGSHDSFAF